MRATFHLSFFSENRGLLPPTQRRVREMDGIFVTHLRKDHFSARCFSTCASTHYHRSLAFIFRTFNFASDLRWLPHHINYHTFFKSSNSFIRNDLSRFLLQLWSESDSRDEKMTNELHNIKTYAFLMTSPFILSPNEWKKTLPPLVIAPY